MAFTGDQHTRYLIATRMMESICQRYNVPVQVLCNHFYVTVIIPEHVELSSSILSEFSDIINRYTKFYYTLKLVNNHFEIRID